MMRFATFSLAAMAMIGLSACSVPTADDVHARGSSNNWFTDTSQYRAVDNAIHDMLVEMFGQSRVELSEYPEKEFHRWIVNLDEFIGADAQRHRYRVEARPQLGEDGKYVPHVKVVEQIYITGMPNTRTPSSDVGRTAWLDGARQPKKEIEIANAVSTKVRAWREAGHQDPGNRRDEYFARHKS